MPPPDLLATLERARELGFLGPGPVAEHEAHADGFRRAWATQSPAAPGSLCDLGAGGGVPGLVLALRWPESRVVLVEAAARRAAFLRKAVAGLGLEHAEVLDGRAEVLARSAALEAAFDLVTARSFGPPAAAAECAARLLRVGGLLLVAEPPQGDPARWPALGLAQLGEELVTTGGVPAIAVIRQREACPARYPRREGVPARRPLF